MKSPLQLLILGLLLRLGILAYILIKDPSIVLANTDALSFFLAASDVAKSGVWLDFEIGWKPYVNIMGSMMGVVGESFVFMDGFSIVGWFATALIIDKILVSIEAPQSLRFLTAAIYSFWPSIVFVTILPLREPFQMLGIALMAMAMIQIAAYRRLNYWLLVILGACISGFTHVAMAAGVLSLILAIFLYEGRLRRSPRGVVKLAFAAALGAIFFSVFLGILASKSVDTSGGVLAAVEDFQETGISLDARAQYKSEAPDMSGIGGIVSIGTGFIQYMTEPMPWKIRSVGDLSVFIENMFRLVLLYMAFRNLTNNNAAKSATALIFLVAYLFIELLWSAGTVNWGTALRHHAPAMPLLLIAAFIANPFRKLQY